MQRDGHRLGERSAPVVETVRDPHAQRRGEQHLLREPTGRVVDEAEREQRLAAHEVGHRHHEVTGCDAGFRSRTQVEDLGTPLVTEHVVSAGIEVEVRPERIGDVHEVLGVLERVEVGAADPARAHGDERIAAERHRIGHLVDDEVVLSCDYGTHRAPSLRSGPPNDLPNLRFSVSIERSVHWHS